MQRRKWLRRVGLAVAVYLALWGLTGVFGPAAVTRWFAVEVRDRPGAEAPIDRRTGVRFVGTGLKFRPDPVPERSPWCCVGEPAAPAPLVVCADYAYVRGGLDGGAGRVYFLWTPWRVYAIAGDRHWSA